MDKSRISVGDLTEDYINAHYYAPRFLENEKLLASCGIPRRPIGAIASKCNCGATPVDVTYGSAGQGLIRTSDVRPNRFESAKVLRTTALDVPRDGATAAITGDLLFTMSGTIGFAAVIPETDDVFSFSNTIARVRFPQDGENDPRFMAAFFSSHHGYTQSLRLTSGGIQGHVMPNPFKRLLVPIPSKLIQKYIGDKIRQAECLREAAYDAATVSEAIVAALLEGHMTEPEIMEGVHLGTVRGKQNGNLATALASWFRLKKKGDGGGVTWSRVPVTLFGERLDSRYYRPEFLRLRVNLRERGAVALDSVTEKVECGPFGGNAIADDLYQPEGLPFFRPVNLSGNRLNTRDLAHVSEPRLVQNGLKIYSGENLFFARVGTPAVALFDGKASISPNVIIAKGDPAAADVGYLYCFCKSPFGLQQLEQELKEGVQPTTSTDAVRRLQVLLPDRRIQEYVGDLCRRSERYLSLADSLVIGARLLVESLIERHILAQELSDAYQALGHGDQSIDRTILARLSEAGIDDANKPPLFPDLDALYRAVEESRSSNSNNGDVR